MTAPARQVVAKMQGAGNDFCVLDGAPPANVGDVVRDLADRRCGVGGDGVLFLERLEGPGTLRMHFYNADGGRANLCLNGSRCVALRAVQLGWAERDVTIETDQQTLRAIVDRPRSEDRGEVRLEIDRPRGDVRWIDLPREGRGARVDTGDPHLVVEVDDFEDFVGRARALRHDASVGPSGANVHFVARNVEEHPGTWRIRSFERGVEGETLACGSGCVSAVAALGDGPTTLRTQSGAVLRIDPRGQRWTLEGPAVLVFETEWSL